MTTPSISAKEFLLIEGEDDFVELRLVAEHVADLLRTSDLERIRDRTLAVIRQLLNEHLIVVGTLDPVSGELLVWECSSDEAVERIDHEWRAIGRKPGLYEVACFRDTPSGQQVGADLKRQFGLP